ncbi:hypothetical protein [Cohnella luojiensis]|nr:hypothetical protein [Cohnella luojiensis]
MDSDFQLGLQMKPPKFTQIGWNEGEPNNLRTESGLVSRYVSLMSFEA